MGWKARMLVARLVVGGLFMAGLLLPGRAVAAVTASVSPKQVAVGEPFEYSITVDGRAKGIDPPQLPALPHMRVVGSGTSTLFQSVNGQISRRTEFNYTLVADKAGTHTIGPAAVVVRGTRLRTEPVTVEVVPASNRSRAQSSRGGSRGGLRGFGLREGDVTIDTRVDMDDPFVGEQVILTFYYDRAVDLYQVDYEPPSTTGFREFELHVPPALGRRSYIKDGRRRVEEQYKMALIPVQPGTATIGSAALNMVVDPFSGAQRLMTDPISVNVRPLPTDNRPDGFAGAVGRFELKARLSTRQIRQGETVTLTVTVSGRGNLHDIAGVILPELDWAEMYDPEISDRIHHGPNGINGSRSLAYPLIPRTPGHYEVGPVKLVVFDPETERYQILTTEPFGLDVSPAPPRTPVPDATAPAAAPDAAAPPPPGGRNRQADLLWALAALVVGVALLIMRKKSGRDGAPAEVAADPPPDLGEAPLGPSAPTVPDADRAAALAALQATLSAPSDAAFLKGLDHCFKGYLAGCWSVPLLALDREFIAARLTDLDDTVREDALSLIDAMDMARYAPGAVPLNRDELAGRARRVIEAVGR